MIEHLPIHEPVLTFKESSTCQVLLYIIIYLYFMSSFPKYTHTISYLPITTDYTWFFIYPQEKNVPNMQLTELPLF